VCVCVVCVCVCVWWGACAGMALAAEAAEQKAAVEDSEGYSAASPLRGPPRLQSKRQSFPREEEAHGTTDEGPH
jgi:hypothetical protein